jgi:p-aminobenzoyl-glutamate transporter AbgT
MLTPSSFVKIAKLSNASPSADKQSRNNLAAVSLEAFDTIKEKFLLSFFIIWYCSKTNATVVDDANQFVSERSSNPRVGKDKSQMEDNDKREVTTNKVFE